MRRTMTGLVGRPRRARMVAVLGAAALVAPASLLGLALTTAPASAASFTVSTGADSGAGSLRQAFADAAASTDPSSTITVNPGVGTITLTTGDVSYAPANNSALTIDGNGVVIHQATAGSQVIADSSSGLLTIDRATISGGTANPGPAAAISTAGDLTLTTCIVTDNSSTSAANNTPDVLRVGTSRTGTLTLINTTVSSNTATATGAAANGGILDSGTTVVTGSTVTANTDAAASSSASGTFDTITTTVTNTTVSGNTTTSAGGEAEGTFDSNDTTLTGSTVTGNKNTAGSSAFGTLDTSNTTLTDSAVTGNTNASTAAGTAEGVFDAGPTTLTRSSVTGNTNSSVAGPAFGGIDATSVTATNSTVSANVASGGTTSTGGGIDDGPAPGPHAADTGSGKQTGRVRAQATTGTTLVYSTVAGNHAQTGANVDTGGLLTSFGSVVANPTGGSNCVLGVTATVSNGWNWSDDTSCHFTATTDHQSGDPGLGGVANNGGPGPTQLPNPGSPLIDAIPIASCQADGAAGITTDERGVARPQLSGCDIGAVEVEVEPTAALLVQPTFTG